MLDLSTHWRVQPSCPEIDRGNPVTQRGVVGVAGGAPGRSIGAKITPTATGITAVPGGFITNGTSSKLEFPFTMGAPSDGDKQTLLLVTTPLALPAAGRAWAAGFGQNGDARGAIKLGIDSAGNLIYGTHTSNGNSSATAGAISIGQRLIIVGRHDQSVVNVCINGTISGFTAAGVGAQITNANVLRVGSFFDFSAFTYYNGMTELAWGANRCLGNEEMRSLAANPWQIFRPLEFIIPLSAAGGGAAALASNATSTASATGNLTTGIPIAGAALVVATGAADVTTGISLATNTQGIASSAGSLTTGIPLAGVAVSAASAGGALSTQINITAAALAQALSSAAMSSGINMPAAAVAQAAADGTLTTAIALIAAAVAQASAGGALTVQIQLSASAISQTAASAGLSTATPLAANATAEASASASLGGGSPLATVAVATATAGGELTTVIPLAAAALAAAIAAGGLTVAIPLAGLAAAVAGATAELTAQIHIAGQAVAMASAMADLDTAAGAWEDNPVWMTARVERLTVMTASVTRAIKYTAGATRAH